MKIAICDDENLWQNRLEKMTAKWAADCKLPVCIELFNSGESFLFAFEQDRDWDVLLLDIEMNGLNGMELAKKLREAGSEAAIIFTTGYAEYMPQGYDVNAMQYLLKPVDEQKLISCLDRIRQQTETSEAKIVFTTVDLAKLSIAPSRIWCVEACGHGSILKVGNRSYECKESIGTSEALLHDTEGIIKCHRSYLVNIRHISEIRREEIVLDDGQRIPVSKSAYRKVNEVFIRYYVTGKDRL